MAPVRKVVDVLAVPSSGLSRRDCLSVAAVGLAAPLLQACGGASDAAPAVDPESVRWCRDAIRATVARNGSQTTTVSVALLATPDSRINIGSVAKMVATPAVMILRERGQLALDQPVAELLPGFRMLSPGFTRITVRHLISRSSGLPGVNLRNLFNFAPYVGYAQDTLCPRRGSNASAPDGCAPTNPRIRSCAWSGRPPGASMCWTRCRDLVELRIETEKGRELLYSGSLAFDPVPI